MIRTETNSPVYTCSFVSWQNSVPHLLNAAGLKKHLTSAKKVIIKPNLVEPQNPPVTTPVELVAALTDYIHSTCPNLDIIIAEGCGSASNNTWQVFEALGYTRLANLDRVSLMDLNEAPLVHLQNSKFGRWPEMYLPKIVFENFLISVPVLKAHSLAGVTLTMKNMMGLTPPEHYQQGGPWKKASFHQGIQEAVFDLNRYRTPDFTLLDATIGMQQAHLWGPTCNPPPNRLAASYDPVAIDSYGCRLLGIKWDTIGHLTMAHGTLGAADPLAISEV
jgi:uncharacterized protein (DUF362 family)